MPENDFEKQVQRLFDELRIKPSENVWPLVQNRVKRDKHRRRIFLWLPAALVALVAGGYWAIQSLPGAAAISEHSSTATKQTTASSSGETATTPSDASPSASDIAETMPTPPIYAKDISKQESRRASADGSNQAGRPVPDRAGGYGAPTGGKPIRRAGEDGSIADEKTALFNNTAYEAGKPAPLASPDKHSNHNNMGKAYQQPEAALQTVAMRGLPILYSPQALNASSVAAPLVQVARPRLWEWGISAGGGISGIDKGSLSDIFRFDPIAERSDALASPSFDAVSGYYNQFLAPQGNTMYAVAPPASVVKQDFSWHAGAFIKRKLNEKFSLSSGLSYHQYTTNRLVGDVNYQNTASLNLSGSTNNRVPRYSGTYRIGGQYTSRYHFIEMPLGLDWKVVNSKKLPVYIHAGLQFSYLIATNALHYDRKSGMYYEDRDMFKRFQTGIYAGISTRVFSGKPYAFNIGPMASYHTSNLTKPVADKRQNLVYAGMKLQWVMGSR